MSISNSMKNMSHLRSHCVNIFDYVENKVVVFFGVKQINQHRNRTLILTMYLFAFVEF